MTPAYHKSVKTEPLIDFSDNGPLESPGFGKVAKGIQSRVRWMGGDAENGPWIYWVQRSPGEIIPPHKHKAGRVEFISQGAIEWYEGQDAVDWYRNNLVSEKGRRYETGSMTWVPAGQVYGYRILEETDVLLWFDGPPGGTTWAK